jgi:hypothetical protein
MSDISESPDCSFETYDSDYESYEYKSVRYADILEVSLDLLEESPVSKESDSGDPGE